MKYFIIDFDSTFVRSEGLEELAEVVLRRSPQKEAIISQIKRITNEGMEGKISFEESLNKRLKILKGNKLHIQQVVRRLQKRISSSIKRNKQFFKQYKESIYIVSGGFREFIEPVVSPFGIEKNHILANSFLLDRKGNVLSYDQKNLLAQKNGKVKAVKSLHLNGEINVIGDGYTDYQIKELGAAKKFIAFTENVKRESVANKADQVAPSFDEFLYINKLPTSISYPKNRIRILLLDNIDEAAGQIFEKEGFRVDYAGDISPEASVLCIRSKTKLSATLINKTKKLMVVGRYGIGVDHIDLKACSDKGIAVFNAPYSNTRSVAEFVIGNIIGLFRKIGDNNKNLHQGIWKKSTKDSHEIRGKVLGIIGYGNIGSQLSTLAEALGMQVIFYDIVEKIPLGNARRCKNLDELLKKSDIISVHMSGNKPLLREKEFEKMKDGIYVINTSRGKVVDVEILAKYIRKGKVRGAAIDVFPNEPKTKGEKFVSPLQNLQNVILTSHIAGITEESQKDIADFVSNKIIDYINTGNTYMSVNFPQIQLPKLKNAHRLLHLHRNVPGILAQINGALAKNKINILGQYLKTNEEIGYVITDVNKKYDKRILSELKQIPNTIRFRVLY